MKIAWFSPLPPDHSEIANHTERLIADLRARHDVRFLTETASGFYEPAIPRSYAAELGWNPPALLRALNTVDVPIYHLGNHPDYFAYTWFLSQAKPGIVVLHDLKLHHLYAGIFWARLQDRGSYLRHLGASYGRLGYEAGMAYWRQELSIEFMAEHFPMTALAIRNALAIVVHTPHALEVVGRLTRTPVRLAALAYVPAAAGRAEPVDAPFTAARPARVILFGYLGVNRRVVEFLTALAALPERERFAVQLVGKVSHLAEVRSAVQTLGLQGQVTFHGYVPEAELARRLDEADLAVNLRFPSMGEASGSQLRIWDHALPSLVTHTEGYATLPPDAVCFVHPARERADIQAHLRGLLERPAAYRAIGAAGRRRLLAHHRPRSYVDALDGLLAELPGLRARHSRLVLASRVGAAAASWLQAAPSAGRADFYAGKIAGLG